MAGFLLKDIANESGLNESTIRFYRQKFPDFFYYNLEGKRKKYAPEVVDIVKFISQCYDENWDAEDIRKALAKNYHQVHDVEPVKKTQEAQQYSKLDMELFREMLAQYMTQMEQRVKDAEEKAINAQEKTNRLELENEKVQRKYNTLLGQVTHLFENDKNRVAKEQYLEDAVKKLENQVQQTDQKIAAWREVAAGREQQKLKPWWKFWGKE